MYVFCVPSRVRGFGFGESGIRLPWTEARCADIFWVPQTRLWLKGWRYLLPVAALGLVSRGVFMVQKMDCFVIVGERQDPCAVGS